VTLTNVVVTDPRSTNSGDVVGTLAVLAIGASQTFTFVYDVQQYEIDANGTDPNGVGDGDGDIDNTATGTSDQAGPVSASAEVEVEQILPPAGAIDLEKYVSVDGGIIWELADDAPGPTMLQGTGNPLFKFVMTNLSNVTATNVVLSDSDFDLDGLVSTAGTGSRPDSATDGPGGIDEVYSLDTLAPDETVEVIFNGAVWQAGQHVNTAQVTYALGTVTTSSWIRRTTSASWR
jgi:hypothetical protein